MADRILLRIAGGGALVALLMFVADEGMTRGGRGGGFGGGARAGGSMSFGRGGSGGFSHSYGGSYGRGGDFSRGGTFSRSGVYSKPGGIGANRPTTFPSRGPGIANAPGGGARPGQLPAGGRPGIGGPSGPGQPPLSRPGQGTRPGQGGGGIQGNQPGQGTRPGQGGGGIQNIGNGNNINIDNDWGGGWDRWHDYPWGAGVAAAAVTAAVIGSTYYALPSGCPPYPYGGYTYYSCGGVWYQPQYEGDTVVYVTVPDPSGGRAQQ